ncbi:anti-sigma factor [Nocardioides sp.]|uniref:anti-sigma factor family protein n=1 Tax=Nocardioides sp. TaxID=35761 RepID=UPI002ED9941C
MTPVSPGSCELTHLDGAYVLGALAPEERLEFERHLADCPVCARAVQQLAGLPGLLSQVSADVLESTPADEQVPDTLLPALVREVRRERRRRRRWAAALAAAAAVVVVTGVSTAVITHDDDSRAPSATPTAPARQMTPVASGSGIEGWLSLTSVPWGTRLDLTCSYEAPVEGYQHAGPPTYEMVVGTADGRTERVASWQGLPGRTMTVSGATAASTDEIVSVLVRSADGHPVLRLTD